MSDMLEFPGDDGETMPVAALLDAVLHASAGLVVVLNP